MDMDPWLKENLVCPRDGKVLRSDNDILICPVGHGYPMVNGVPIMLLDDVEQTHEAAVRSLHLAKTCGPAQKDDADNDAVRPGEIDGYVQSIVGATCGHLYKPLINKLTEYPIPELRMPDGGGGMFLDIGCNWGRWCIAAARKGYCPVGIDPSLDAIFSAQRVSRQLGVPARYVVADARYLPFAQNTFDVVFSYSVFQHLSKDHVKMSLARIDAVLKESGACLVQMPNAWGIRCLYHQARRRFREASEFEVRYWSLPELKETFTRCIGKTVLSVDGYFGLGIQKSDTRLLPPKCRMIIHCSEVLRWASEFMPWMKYFADSLYVKSTHERTR